MDVKYTEKGQGQETGAQLGENGMGVSNWILGTF